MTTKITFIFDNPVDPAAFESSYADLLDFARKIPGTLKLETSKVWPKEDGTPTPAYRLIDLYFPDYDAANAAVTTPEMGALYPHALESATGGVRVVFADIEES
ncbi:EthD family reductase [Kribbella sp. NPDC054772]